MPKLLFAILMVAMVGVVHCQPTPNSCDTNEVWNSCGTACPATCENKDTERICTDQCVAGCECKDEHVRDTYSGKCIYHLQCPLHR